MVRESITVVMVFQNLSIKEGAFMHVVAIYILERACRAFPTRPPHADWIYIFKVFYRIRRGVCFGGLPNGERGKEAGQSTIRQCSK